MITKTLVLAHIAYVSFRHRAYLEDIIRCENGDTIARLTDNEGRRYSLMFEGAHLYYANGFRCFTSLLKGGVR
jgi:hypothetical protein